MWVGFAKRTVPAVLWCLVAVAGGPAGCVKKPPYDQTVFQIQADSSASATDASVEIFSQIRDLDSLELGQYRIVLGGPWEQTNETSARRDVRDVHRLDRYDASTSIWFDFFPNIDIDYAHRLVKTESIYVTAAIRAWTECDETQLTLQHQAARELACVFGSQYRHIYLVDVERGVVVIQCFANFRDDDADEAMTWEHRANATELVHAFVNSDVLSEENVEAMEDVEPPELKPERFIPRNIDECVAELKKILEPEQIEKIAADEERKMIMYHHGLGTFLRNNWGLWSDSRLAKYFRDLGVSHPDSMSGIILTSFWRHLKGVPIDLEGQIEEDKQAWEEMKNDEEEFKRKVRSGEIEP